MIVGGLQNIIIYYVGNQNWFLHPVNELDSMDCYKMVNNQDKIKENDTHTTLSTTRSTEQCVLSQI